MYFFFFFVFLFATCHDAFDHVKLQCLSPWRCDVIWKSNDVSLVAKVSVNFESDGKQRESIKAATVTKKFWQLDFWWLFSPSF